MLIPDITVVIPQSGIGSKVQSSKRKMPRYWRKLRLHQKRYFNNLRQMLIRMFRR